MDTSPVTFVAEVRERLRAVREDCRERFSQAMPNLSDEQRDALRAALETLVEGALQVCDAPDATVDEVWDALVVVDRTALLVRQIGAQHIDDALGPNLALAEECLASAYAVARRLLPGKLSPAHPVILLEAMHSPAIYLASSTIAFGGGKSRGTLELPLPLLLSSPEELAGVQGFPLLFHELGHHVVCEGELLAAGRERLAGSAWGPWCEEILTDLVGVSLSGPALALRFTAMHERLKGSRRLGQDREHPSLATRREIVLAYLQRCGAVPAALATTSPPSEGVGGLLDALAPVLGPFSRLPGQDLTAVEAAAAWLERRGGEPPALERRLVPAAVALAGAVAGLEDGVRELCREGFRWALPADAWDGVRDRFRRMIPTLLAREGERMLKKPPVEILAGHEILSFVGATHWQLAGSLARAFELRERRRWGRIEVFFLADARVGSIVRAGAPAGGMVEEKRGAMAALRGRLGAFADRWTIHEYDDPFVFAAFFDCEEADRTRARIHLSPYAWGQDVATCPSVDYVSDAKGVWSDWMEVHVRGLKHLRATARLVASDASG